MLFLCVLGSILAWLAFGERGLIRLYRTEIEREVGIDRIRQLVKENQTLEEEIRRLNTDMDYVESVVRKEFNLIKENEIIYRFNKDKTSPNGSVKMPLEPGHEDESRRSATKVGHNEKIK
ncbi:MAG: septum formation initiator family protein [Desulfobacteraceae bacterium]|nr:septum formation initiator family protein [Desulfobacteraceae bacterium]